MSAAANDKRMELFHKQMESFQTQLEWFKTQRESSQTQPEGPEKRGLGGQVAQVCVLANLWFTVHCSTGYGVPEPVAPGPAPVDGDWAVSCLSAPGVGGNITTDERR